MNRNMVSQGLTFRLVVSRRPSFEVLDWCIGRYARRGGKTDEQNGEFSQVGDPERLT